MIKFFRHIRKRLLTENKFSKYLLYAIGEIVLVIIGILIALQINNANTERKENKELQSYFKNIEKNILFDIKNIEEIISKRKATSVNAKTYLQLLEKENFSAEELFDAFGNNNDNIFIEFYFQPDQSGFDALTNSGYLNKITGTEIETKLYEYNYHIKKIHEQEKSMNEFIENMEVILFSQNHFNKLMFELNQVGANPDYLTNNRAKIKTALDIPVLTAAAQRGTSDKFLKKYYDELIITGNEIISIINDKK
jgi:hypothetical protein